MVGKNWSMDDTFDLEKLVLAATTAKDDEICSLFLFAPPCLDPYCPALFFGNTQSIGN